MVWSQPCHPVTKPDAEPPQTVGQPANPAGQLRIGERAVVPHQRHLAGGDPGSALNPGADSEVGRNRRHPGHGQGYPPPAPRGQEATPRHVDAQRVKPFAGHGSPTTVEENPNGYAGKRSHPDLAAIHGSDTSLTAPLSPEPAWNVNDASVYAGQCGGGAPRRNRTGDPILTIDGRPVRGTTRHLAALYRTTGNRPYQ